MAIHHAANTVLKTSGPKVDQESEGKLHQSQVRQQLLGVDRRKLLHRFELQQQASAHDEVGAKPFVEVVAIELHRNPHLPRHGQSAPLQLVGENRLIDGLEQPGTGIAMHAVRGIDHDRRHLLQGSQPPLGIVASFVPSTAPRIHSTALRIRHGSILPQAILATRHLDTQKTGYSASLARFRALRGFACATIVPTRSREEREAPLSRPVRDESCR